MGLFPGLMEIFKTIDGGNSWTDIAAENNFYHFKNIQFTNASTGYCVGEHGKMQKTTDGGQTWSYLPTSTTYDLNDLFFEYKSGIYCW